MRITIIAFEGCMTSAVYGQADAFAIAGYIAGRRADPCWSQHDVRIATPAGAPVQGYGGHMIAPDGALAETSDGGVILIPPIFGDIEQTLVQERALVAWLATRPARSTLLASSCTGAFLLAEAGVLAGRRVTTNPAFGALFAKRYPALRLDLDARLIDDGAVICAGATTSYLYLAIHVIDRLAGHDLAVATAKALSIDRNPDSQRPYVLFIAPRDHGDDRVLKLQGWIEAHHDKPIVIADMVDAAGMSVRNLNRRFVTATGLSPRQYLRRVRIEAAKRLLEGRSATLDRVAAAVGYGDTRAFVRSFAEVTGLSPGQYRRRFREGFSADA